MASRAKRNQLTAYSVKCQICTITVHIVSWHRLILRLLTMSHHRGDFCFLSPFLSFHCVVCFLACSDFSLGSHGSPARICNQLNGLTQHYADLPDWQKTGISGLLCLWICVLRLSFQTKYDYYFKRADFILFSTNLRWLFQSGILLRDVCRHISAMEVTLC